MHQDVFVSSLKRGYMFNVLLPNATYRPLLYVFHYHTFTNKAIVDNSDLANLTKHNVVFDSAPLAAICNVIHTSSTKPEVHNILHCQVTATVNMYIKFCEVWTCGF